MDFLFPVGKGTRYGYFSVTSTNTSGPQIWKAEYNTSFSDYLDPLTPLVAVSSSEHWQITGPASGTCLVTGRWDPSERNYSFNCRRCFQYAHGGI